jgi:hypothetical protein
MQKVYLFLRVVVPVTQTMRSSALMQSAITNGAHQKGLPATRTAVDKVAGTNV